MFRNLLIAMLSFLDIVANVIRQETKIRIVKAMRRVTKKSLFTD